MDEEIPIVYCVCCGENYFDCDCYVTDIDEPHPFDFNAFPMPTEHWQCHTHKKKEESAS